jgi:phosphoribosylglycinamide formyltransferase-1
LKKIGVLLSGRGSNFKAIYNAIRTGKIRNAFISQVISNNSEAPGLLFARQEGINALYVNPADFHDRQAYDESIVNILKQSEVDVVCLAGYMRILSSDFVEAFKDRILNIHPALLPSFPGLDAQKQALEYGVKITGCTVHFVDKKVDHGPIILQKAVEVMDNDTVESLSARILKREHEIYPEAVKLFLENRLVVANRKVLIKSAQ